MAEGGHVRHLGYYLLWDRIQVKLQLTGKSSLTFQFYLINRNLGYGNEAFKASEDTEYIQNKNLYYGISYKFPSLLSNKNMTSNKPRDNHWGQLGLPVLCFTCLQSTKTHSFEDFFKYSSPITSCSSVCFLWTVTRARWVANLWVSSFSFNALLGANVFKSRKTWLTSQMPSTETVQKRADLAELRVEQGIRRRPYRNSRTAVRSGEHGAICLELQNTAHF